MNFEHPTAGASDPGTVSALILRVGQETVAIPLDSVSEIVSLDVADRQTVGGRPVIKIRHDVLPFEDLSTRLGWNPGNPVVCAIVFSAECRIAFGADGFEGREDLVVRKKGKWRADGVANVATRRTGEIILLLDIPHLLGA